MIDALIRFSLRNRSLVFVLACVLLVAGTYTALKMPVDVFPDLTAPTVTILTEAHGMAPSEVESQITIPVESAMNGAGDVRRVRSSTGVGLSIVWVEFNWGTDIREARQIVSEKLGAISSELPPEIERPLIAPVSSIMGEIAFISLFSSNHSPSEVRSVADNVLRRRLLAVPGVSQVIPIGGDVKQYQVHLDPQKLLSRGVTLVQVRDALADGNQNISAGFIAESSAEYLITGIGRIHTLDDIASTVVTLTNGFPIKVSDVGQVMIGAAPKRGEASANGRRAVVISIQKQPGANTLALTRQLDRVLDDLGARLPVGMVINKNLFRQADFINIAVSNVQDALRDGGIFVAIIVLLFLLNVRATLITLTAIPLSLVTAILILQAFDATINTMTLGGFAIAIGALVDDAVIDVENVFRRLRENNLLPDSQRRPVLDVVFNASVEVRSSIFFATMIIVLVFLPLFFLSGVEGRLLKPLGIAYVVALLGSLLVAVTLTPVLCYWLLPKSKGVLRGHEPRTVVYLKRAYSPLLNSAMNHPWLATIPAVILLLISLFALSRAGKSFLPEFNEGALTITSVTLPGTPLAESDSLGAAVEKVVLAYPEVQAVARRTGRAELDEHAQGVESSELEVRLQMKNRSKDEFLEALRNDLSTVPGVNITIGQPISHRIDHMLSGTRASIAMKIFGNERSTLRALAEQVRSVVTDIPGVVDLFVEPQIEVPVLRIVFDRNNLARHGLHIREAGLALQAGLQGLKVSTILEGASSFDLVLRLAQDGPSTLDSISALLLDTPAGYRIPLSEVARITKDIGPNTISREQVERTITVSCNVAGRDLGSVVADCQKAVQPVLVTQPGYRVELGGQFESAQQANRILLALGLLVIVGIALLLRTVFNSGRDAALIMLNLPLALMGGILGVFLSGGIVSVASLVGFITVFGIATRNGIMLISHVRHLHEAEGVTNFRDAVFRGSMERLSPILMTALAAGLALIPLALGGGKPGNEIQTPMAIVILCGLLTSMVLNMIIVPALYYRFGQRSPLSN